MKDKRFYHRLSQSAKWPKHCSKASLIQRFPADIGSIHVTYYTYNGSICQLPKNAMCGIAVFYGQILLILSRFISIRGQKNGQEEEKGCQDAEKTSEKEKTGDGRDVIRYGIRIPDAARCVRYMPGAMGRLRKNYTKQGSR